MDELLADSSNLNAFDFAFVDADKLNYPAYYDKLLELIKPGGFIMLDNTFWDGTVASEEDRTTHPETKAIFGTVEKAMHDDSVEVHTLAIGDGFTIVRKK